MNASRRRLAGAAAAVGLAIVTWNSLFVVAEGRQAVLLRPGAPAATVGAGAAPVPGLYLKWPFVERAVSLDRRVETLAAAPETVLAADGARYRVHALAAYRIVDPVRAIQAGGEAVVRARLDTLTGAVAASALQGARAADLLAGRVDPVRLAAALAALRRSAATAGLGVEVVDLAPQGATLTDLDAARAASFEQAYLARAAGQVRAEAEAARQAALGAADREAADIRGAGEAAALRVRGSGDAARADILGAADAKDPGFAAYLRRLDAYDGALNPATTTLVLSPDSNAFLSSFGHGTGRQK